MKQWGKAEAACMAHNHDVGGSIPLPAIYPKTRLWRKLAPPIYVICCW